MKHLLLACILLAAAPAFSQTDPTVTLGASVTNANGSLSTTLTWSTTPAATSCTASGSPSWTGTKAASGTLALPAITLSGTYSLTLNCSWPGDNTATVKWVAPTTNTDGSALAKCANADTVGPCLAFYRVYRRVGTPDMSGAEMTEVRDPNALQFVKTGLVAGVHFFGVEVINGNGVPSALSNIASKTITATVSKSAGVTLTVNPKPNAPVLSIE